MPPTDTESTLAERLLQIARALPPRRLTPITHEGKSYFVKMPEQHASLRWRLQKGDPKAAFAREVELLRGFAAKGAAVARIVAAESDRIVLADHGTPLQSLVYRGQADASLMQRTGAALAELHARGLAHGRPSLRDICWNDKDLTFLDLEAGARLHARTRDKARDLSLLLHSVYATLGTETELAELALQGYRAAGSETVWRKTQSLSRNLWWLEYLAQPGVWLHRLRGKTRSEYAAIRATRALIARA
ncbi:lipopolysaccharide kinase InaA family protein [Natronohydrobacter thiooxidans]|uniref:lipopolysaccharide kinase InaA family protein n=1 Tax=Natronohydrobacter thiooxidans TaxID=87172 RepID=UPI0008FF6793|nr:lipopolysaccharide kinase InaA family protein [Natronohydrobacter thiooxidans]